MYTVTQNVIMMYTNMNMTSSGDLFDVSPALSCNVHSLNDVIDRKTVYYRYT